jgi:tRNA threonylcarbamoyladenosine biosynthesis protein TsaB
MLVLAIDTATSRPALALAGLGGDNGGFEDQVDLPSGSHASESLLVSAAALLGRAGRTLADIGRVGALAGPGSFTGIRVGLATAWGFSRSLGIPLETIGSLEAIAETARSSGESSVTARLDAERGDVYVATYDLSGVRAREIAPPRLAAAGSPLPGGVTVVPGEPGAPVPALAAARVILRSPGADASVPRALYVRASAAEERDGIART